MTIQTSNNITRYAGDTYPDKSIIKVQGVPVDITGWDVNLRYRDDTGTTMVVDCVVTNGKEGRIAIFPHSRREDEEPITDRITDEMASHNDDLTSNQCWTLADINKEFPFSIVRKRRFGDYEEIMTHNVGIVSILERV